MNDLHPIVSAAAEGRLPGWAALGELRRGHVHRVAALLDSWALGLGLGERDRARWRAAGLLHDALREAPPSQLRSRVAPLDARVLPDLTLHGPAAAERLRSEGVMDGELLLAVGRHTTGHRRFCLMGKALYVADLVEPGRPLGPWRNELIARLPAELPEVTLEVAERRLVRGLRRGRPLIPHAVGFWNALAGAEKSPHSTGSGSLGEVRGEPRLRRSACGRRSIRGADRLAAPTHPTGLPEPIPEAGELP